MNKFLSVCPPIFHKLFRSFIMFRTNISRYVDYRYTLFLYKNFKLFFFSPPVTRFHFATEWRGARHNTHAVLVLARPWCTRLVGWLPGICQLCAKVPCRNGWAGSCALFSWHWSHRCAHTSRVSPLSDRGQPAYLPLGHCETDAWPACNDDTDTSKYTFFIQAKKIR